MASASGNGAPPQSESAPRGLTLRSLVSKKKLRFVDDSFDLDLTYITPRIIAMGFPSVGIEALYRNPATQVKRFFEGRHGGHYRIWNLCVEKDYVAEALGLKCDVERYCWADHTPPPLALLRPACESMGAWLGAHPDNVAVVHCKAGKGRTGTLIAAYLLLSGECSGPDEALTFFGAERTRNGRGVTIPSQLRFVRYWGAQRVAMREAEAGWPGSAPAAQLALVDALATAAMPPVATIASAVLAPILAASATARELWRCDDADEPGGVLVHVVVGRDGVRDAGFSVARDAAGRLVVVAVQAQAGHTEPPPGTAHVSTYVRVGDEIAGVGHEAPPARGSTEMGSASFPSRIADAEEGVLLLRNSIDPLAITIARWEAAAVGGGGPAPCRSPQEWLGRVARAVGPWAPGSDPRVVPAPAVQLLSLSLSHAPTVKPTSTLARLGAACRKCLACLARGLLGSCIGLKGGPSTDLRGLGDVTIQLFGGHLCRTLLFDSRSIDKARKGVAVPGPVPEWRATKRRAGSGSGSRSAQSPGRGKGKEKVEAGPLGPSNAWEAVAGAALAREAAAGVVIKAGEPSFDPAHGPIEDPALLWGPRHLAQRLALRPTHVPPTGVKGRRGSLSPSTVGAEPRTVVLAGDFRLVLQVAGQKKALFTAYLHTAELPLPHALRRAVVPVLEALEVPGEAPTTGAEMGDVTHLPALSGSPPASPPVAKDGVSPAEEPQAAPQPLPSTDGSVREGQLTGLSEEAPAACKSAALERPEGEEPALAEPLPAATEAAAEAEPPKTQAEGAPSVGAGADASVDSDIVGQLSESNEAGTGLDTSCINATGLPVEASDVDISGLDVVSPSPAVTKRPALDLVVAWNAQDGAGLALRSPKSRAAAVRPPSASGGAWDVLDSDGAANHPTLGAVLTAGSLASRRMVAEAPVEAADPLTSTVGTLILFKRQLDGPGGIKDKKHAVWPCDLRLALTYRLLDAPGAYFEAVLLA
jgi:phosphatidylinositol-3,4,5-trisphosphate 3-phosphatase/dual-specificity protein phosphatase PTEN